MFCHGLSLSLGFDLFNTQFRSFASIFIAKMNFSFSFLVLLVPSFDFKITKVFIK